MNVIGGMSSLAGALLGTVFMVTLPELLRGYVNLQQIMFGFILFATMAFLPGGLIELGRRLRKLLWGGRPDAPPVAETSAQPSVAARARPLQDAGARMTRLLSVEKLSKSFGGLQAVAELSFGVDEGQILGIIGPNGAGKTTAVNLVSGVIKPTSGARHAGRPGRHGPSAARAGRERPGAHVPDHHRLRRARPCARTCCAAPSATSIRACSPRCSAPPRRARRACGPSSTWTRSCSWLDLARVADQVASNLPYGFQKVLGMGIGLAARPRLILLDEPAAGLSAEETDHVRDTIRLVRERGISVVVIDHNMRFITDLCDHVLVMAQGRELAQGKPQDVLRNATVIEAYLGKRYAQAQH